MSSRFESIIAEYNKALSRQSEHIEIEAKIQDLDATTFMDSLKGLPADMIPYSIECTINDVTDAVDSYGKYTYIKTTSFDGNTRVAQGASTKRLLGAKFTSKDKLMKYTLAVSAEKIVPIDPKMDTFGTFIRAKLRCSLMHPSNGWRYDYTLSITKQRYDLVAGTIMDIRKRLFDGVTVKDMSRDKMISILSTRAKYPDVTCELEVEKVSNTPIESFSEIDAAVSIVWRSLGSTDDSDERISILRTVYESISNNSNTQTRLTLKTILNAAKSLTKSDYYTNIYPPLGWFVTDKADGERAILYANGTECYVITKDLVKVTIPIVPYKMIADCELITLPKGKLLAIFDVMVCGPEAISIKGIEERIKYADEIVAATHLGLSSVNIDVTIKEYRQISQPIEESILDIYNRKRAYKTDGLILTSQGSNYYETRNLKWKPSDENTIDFMAIELPRALEGLSPIYGGAEDGTTVYALLVGTNLPRRRLLGTTRQWEGYEKDTGVSLNAGYQPSLFKSSIYPYSYIFRAPAGTPPLHGRIVELSIINQEALAAAYEKVDKMTDIWKFVRVREDRSPAAGEYGNDYDVAESVFSNVIDPFLIENLYDNTNGGYFEKSRDAAYKASNRFKRYVIREVLGTKISEGNTVLDMAAGRGADLPTYHELGVRRLVALDIDPTALVELIRRSMDPHVTDHRRSKTPMNIHVLVANAAGNVNLNARAIKDRFGVIEVNTIVCNFALHYMCKTSSQCDNFFCLARDMAGDDTKLICTIMNGKKIFDLLADYETGEVWESADKYAIRKDYDDDKLMKFGQMIAVKLPMTTKMYPEPLANIEAIVSVAESCGWYLESSKGFADYLSAFVAKGGKDVLSPEDIKYCSLHEVLIFYRKKTDHKRR